MAALVEFDELWRPTREKFTVAEVGRRSHVKIIHHEMTREWAMTHPAHHHLTVADVKDLERAGMIEVDWSYGRDGRRGEARLTMAGEREIDRMRSPSPTPMTPVTSSWSADIRPVLEAAYGREQSLAPDVGVTQDALNVALGRPRRDPATTTALVQLSAAGYLRDELSDDQTDGPIMFRLAEKALQQLAGWPGAGGDLTAQLVDAHRPAGRRSRRLRGGARPPRSPARLNRRCRQEHRDRTAGGADQESHWHLTRDDRALCVSDHQGSWTIPDPPRAGVHSWLERAGGSDGGCAMRNGTDALSVRSRSTTMPSALPFSVETS